MAQIEYRINFTDGKANVIATVSRIDPGDEVHLVTDTPNAALHWTAESPFAEPGNVTLYRVPHASAPREPLQVLKSSTLSPDIVQCGESDSEGNFAGWPGGGFPDGSKGQSRAASDSQN